MEDDQTSMVGRMDFGLSAPLHGCCLVTVYGYGKSSFLTDSGMKTDEQYKLWNAGRISNS